MDKVIITAAICGAEVTREHTPHIPISANELAEEARKCVDAGASIIHLHVRRPDGTPSQDLKLYREAFSAIHDKCNILPIIQPSTGGAVGMTFEERKSPLQLFPEMATLDCGTVNFGDDIFVNDLPLMRKFADEMRKNDILPELECFDIGHIHNALLLKKETKLDKHLHFNFVLGLVGAMNASGTSLVQMAQSIPDDATWSAAGIGRHQLSMVFLALGMGGNVRVGLEDNIYYSKGVLSEGNAPFVERVSRLARELGREPATPGEARKILGITKERKKKIKL